MALTRPDRDAPLVLVGFAESLAAVECSWLLLDAGFRVAAFCRAGRSPALGRDRRVELYVVPAPEEAVDPCERALDELVRRLAPNAVVPLDDAAVWLCDRVWATGQGFPALAGPRGAAARLALDKSRQIEVAERCGFAVPATVVLSPGVPSGRPVPDTPGPWIAKPALAARVQDGRLVRGAPVRLATVEEAHSVACGLQEPMLVQSVVHGVGEGVFGHATRVGVVAWSGHRRIRMMHPNGSGSSACRSIEPDPQLLGPATRFVAETGWSGPFMLELLRDDAGTPWWMELNGRMWGSLALARRRGLRYPEWAVRAALDAQYVPPEPPPAPHVVARHLGRELVHLAVVARGPRTGQPAADWPRPAATLREVARWRRGDRLYNARRGALRVLAADTWQTLRAAQTANAGRNGP